MYLNASTTCVCSLLIVSQFALPSLGADDLPVTKRDLKTAEAKLKSLALACQGYHDACGTLPGNITAEDGTPLLSWRVAILPYMDEESLYRQFKLDEPWDSVVNKKLIEKMPDLYKPVRVQAKAGLTYYQVFEGEDTLFVPKKPLYTLAIITTFNGTSNTGHVFEAGDPVAWSKPADLHFDPKKPLPKLGGLFDGDFHVIMCDGSVAFLKKDPDKELLKCIINPANVKVFDGRKLMKAPGGKS